MALSSPTTHEVVELGPGAEGQVSLDVETFPRNGVRSSCALSSKRTCKARPYAALRSGRCRMTFIQRAASRQDSSAWREVPVPTRRSWQRERSGRTTQRVRGGLAGQLRTAG